MSWRCRKLSGMSVNNHPAKGKPLLVGKGTDFLAEHGDCADQRVLFEHGHHHESSYPAKFDHIYADWIALFVTLYFSRIIQHMDDPFRRDEAPKCAQRVGAE